MMDIESYLGMDQLKTDHDEFYTSIVNELGLENVVPYLPEKDKEKLQEAYSKNPYLNNIPLYRWDMASHNLRQEFKRLGITSLSLSESVCTLKQAARMYMNQN